MVRLKKPYANFNVKITDEAESILNFYASFFKISKSLVVDELVKYLGVDKLVNFVLDYIRANDKERNARKLHIRSNREKLKHISFNTSIESSFIIYGISDIYNVSKSVIINEILMQTTDLEIELVLQKYLEE